MSSSENGRKRATVHDLALEAGVSLATIDRVLNRRAGVRPTTIAKVEKAIAKLDFRRDLGASLLARSRDIRVDVFLPAGENRFMANLAAAFAEQGRARTAERMQVVVKRVRALDARAMAKALDAVDPSQTDCAIIVAADSAPVRTAVAGAEERGVPVITLVSDLPDSGRRLFIGIDNHAAGRTAASLMGRFVAEGARIGLIAGSLDLRDHRQRYEGFAEIMIREFPRLSLIGPLEGHDESAGTSAAASSLIAENPDLAGIYSMGAGNSGLVEALKVTGRAGRVRVIGHELTDVTTAALRDGTFDVVVDQNPQMEVRASLDAARAMALGPGSDSEGLDNKIEIGIFLRDNLR